MGMSMEAVQREVEEGGGGGVISSRKLQHDFIHPLSTEMVAHTELRFTTLVPISYPVRKGLWW